mgnify:CR=1 FL=1
MKLKLIILIFAMILLGLNAKASGEQCQAKEQLFDGRCYSCDPETGYLEFNPNDRSVICISCNEGFKLENKKCELKPPIAMKSKINIAIDNLAERISQYLNTTIIIGYIAIFIVSSFIIYYVYRRLYG